MLKNTFVYQFAITDGATSLDLTNIGEKRFEGCTGYQELAIGWSPVRHAESILADVVNGHIVLLASIETKSVPSDVVNRKVNEVVSAIDANEARKPGRKEMREIRDSVRQELIPAAFPKRTDVWVYIDTKRNRVLLGAGSQGVADSVATLLIQTFDNVSISLVNTTSSPASMMVMWLTDHESVPDSFAVGRGVELKANDESKATVKFANHHLEAEKMREHISQGKLPTKLDLEWNDRVNFVLTEGLQIKKIKLLDIVFADQDGARDFDADVTIITSELGSMLDDLIAAHGGLLS